MAASEGQTCLCLRTLNTGDDEWRSVTLVPSAIHGRMGGGVTLSASRLFERCPPSYRRQARVSSLVKLFSAAREKNTENKKTKTKTTTVIPTLGRKEKNGALKQNK